MAQQSTAESPTQLGALIAGARGGDTQAISRLFALLYDDLHRVAHARLRAAGPSTSLDTTALLHESFTRFAGLSKLEVDDRAHFMAYASRVMRSVIVDAVRERMAEKRGGGEVRITLTTGLGASLGDTGNEDVLGVHEALEELAQIDARAAQVVEMRYYGGLDHGEIASVLGVSERTVQREWEKARSFLFAALKRH